MRSFFLATVLAVAAAQNDPEEVNVTPFKITWPDDNLTVYAEGQSAEVVTTNEDGSKLVIAYTSWNNVCDGCNFENGALIQDWIQMEDTENPGKYNGSNCNAVYLTSNSYYNDAAVRNFWGVDSLSENGKTWDSYGHSTDDALQYNLKVPEGEGAEDAYVTTYVNEKKKPKYSSQLCTLWSPLY